MHAITPKPPKFKAQFLRLTTRDDSPDTWQIDGIIHFIDGTRSKRIRKTAHARERAEAEAEADQIEWAYVDAWRRGDAERADRGDRFFSEIAMAYLNFPGGRSEWMERRILRIQRLLGPEACASEIDQEKIEELIRKVIKKHDPARNTIKADVVSPITAVLNFGARRHMCQPAPKFELPKKAPAKTLAFTPQQARRLIEAAVPHLRAVLWFMLCTGARVSETLALDWSQVNFRRGTVTFWQKGERERIAFMPPALVAVLAALPHREGAVFRWRHGYRSGAYLPQDGGQIAGPFRNALKRAGLDEALKGASPHTCRHTFATWHYALFHDLLMLKEEGGWESLGMVERYTKAYLKLDADDADIRAFWGIAASARRLQDAAAAAAQAKDVQPQHVDSRVS